MIHKYWNVRLHQGTSADEPLDSEENATEELRKMVKESEESVEEKVLWIWRTLSSFEEKSATCISDMLLHVSNGAYVDGVMTAKRFITHVDLLFSAADNLDQVLQSHTAKGAFVCRVAFHILTNLSQVFPIREKPNYYARKWSHSSSCSPNLKKLA
jgi:hypothetical protein